MRLAALRPLQLVQADQLRGLNYGRPANTGYSRITFVRRPAETGVTYHVQESANLAAWRDIATYAGTNIVLTAQAAEVSRTGSPNESVTVRDTSVVNNNSARFLRLGVTHP